MEIQGKVLQVLPEERFNGRNGELVRNSFVIEVANGNYPKRLKFDVLKLELWQRMHVEVGTNVQVMFDIESREWNGKWFTSLNCWRVMLLTSNNVYSNNNAQVASSTNRPSQPQVNVVANGVPYENVGKDNAQVKSNDDLPF